MAPADLNLPCFLTGTRITTLRGEVRVEHLTDNDMVKTHLTGLAPIIWIGRSPFDARRHPQPELVWPILIRAGALAPGLPRNDLRVSPGHSLMLDGQLVQAGKLVNGATIVQDQGVTKGTYFHVETPAHDILYSEGAPSETYLDTGNRSAFANGGSVADLHPDYRPRHPTETCLPLVEDPSALQQRLRDRAVELGWHLQQRLEPTLIAGGQTLQPTIRDRGFFLYPIPSGSEVLRLRSPSGVPRQMLPNTRDERRIGLSICRITLVSAEHVAHTVSLDSSALTDGWHEREGQGARTWRWTNGDAGLTVAGAAWLELTVDSAQPHWTPPPLSAPHHIFVEDDAACAVPTSSIA